MLTHDILCSVLEYNQVTGVFRWKRKCGKMLPGAVAGSRMGAGYWRVRVHGNVYLAHRLAWFYVHGVWPEHEIDHRDGNPANNSLANLRAATHAQNLRNQRQRDDNNSGRKGVYWHARERKWKAQICVMGKTTGLGTFKNRADAIAARVTAERELFGEYRRPIL